MDDFGLQIIESILDGPDAVFRIDPLVKFAINDRILTLDLDEQRVNSNFNDKSCLVDSSWNRDIHVQLFQCLGPDIFVGFTSISFWSRLVVLLVFR